MISITMQCRIIILPFCSADSATKRATRRRREESERGNAANKCVASA